MASRREFTVAALSGTAAALCLPAAAAQSHASALFDPTLPGRICDALVAVFGAHPRFRLAHAKGVVCEGTFSPSANAKALSSAEHFAHDVPVTVRFSDFAGTPTVPSTDASASPHGIGIKFHLADRDTDIVGHSANAFPGATGEEFLAFLEALAQTNDSMGKPSSIEKYVASHPAALRFVQSIPRPPVSYATTAYFMLNAFVFVDSNGEKRYGRYRVLPKAGVAALQSEDVPKQPPDYLRDELARRLTQGPAAFTVEVQLARPGDPTNDNTKAWSPDRQVVELGSLTLTRVVADSPREEQTLLFDPARLTRGIELSDDPMPALRSATYAVSMARRSQSTGLR